MTPEYILYSILIISFIASDIIILTLFSVIHVEKTKNLSMDLSAIVPIMRWFSVFAVFIYKIWYKERAKEHNSNIRVISMKNTLPKSNIHTRDELPLLTKKPPDCEDPDLNITIPIPRKVSFLDQPQNIQNDKSYESETCKVSRYSE